MSIILELPETLERQLREKAHSHGVSLNHLIIQNLSDKEVYSSASPMSEADLVKKINEGLPEKDWLEYRRLSVLRKAALLSTDEQKSLIDLVNKIENAHAQRMNRVLELSKIRHIPFLELMAQMGIQPAHEHF